MFRNRQHAGILLAQRLKQYKGKKEVLVLGIARGGVVVAQEIASNLLLSLDVLVIRKIGAPQNPELAIGAIGPQSTVFWDILLIRRLGITQSQKANLRRQKFDEQKEKENILRAEKMPLNVANKKIILVDDGIATGATVLCAIKFLRRQKAQKIILAVPVIAKDTFYTIERLFDAIIALDVEQEFAAVGQFYEEFPQVFDEQVVKMLRD